MCCLLAVSTERVTPLRDITCASSFSAAILPVVLARQVNVRRNVLGTAIAGSGHPERRVVGG